MHLILTGATGTVGTAVLHHCLASPTVTKLSILSRRQFALPVGDDLDVKKADIIVHEDYLTYPQDLLKRLNGAEGCIWAQGISQSQVKKDDYIRITHDYPVAAAKSFSSLSSTGKFNFVYVSGEGADPTENSMLLFGKIKGRTESELLSLPTASTWNALRVFNVRPGYVDPITKHHPSTPVVPRLLVDYAIAPFLRKFMPNSVAPANVLAKVLLDLAASDGNALQPGIGIEAGGRTLRNSAVRRLGGA
ncbi:hypothetical protein POJ06DRAFT_40679 [Lipomyces tetrasporus]|uniref:Nucleoside-diphosphate-sugar epimerase n=1 Tax=Lipomyces tetrasporus TaxID=54092 RepID=A0AAD7VP16_9ASCO|nr:uncharacterized protein POJ06DRAFT_40679 [Lipomyces tetrasporus]KAJ8097177.1 hypothetical protein POJ06DRAFT_40679 [Lipomyces tetrasporus]